MHQLSERTGPGFWHNRFLLPSFVIWSSSRCSDKTAQILWIAFADCIWDTYQSPLIWIQTVWHSEGMHERIFEKSWFGKNISWRQKKHVKLSRIPWRGYIITCCKRVSLKHWNLQNALLAILFASWVNVNRRLHIFGGTLSYFQYKVLQQTKETCVFFTLSLVQKIKPFQKGLLFMLNFPLNTFSIMSGHLIVFLDGTSTKQRIHRLPQGCNTIPLARREQVTLQSKVFAACEQKSKDQTAHFFQCLCYLPSRK